MVFQHGMKFDQHTLFGRRLSTIAVANNYASDLRGAHIRSVGVDPMYTYLRSLYDIMLSNDWKRKRGTEKRNGKEGGGILDIVAGSNALNDTEIFDTQRKHLLVPHTSSLAAFSDAATG
jgi:hypothetical protein